MAMRTCTYCRARIPRLATVCRYCHRDLPLLPGRRGRTRFLLPVLGLAAGLCVGTVLLAGALYRERRNWLD
ncbi:MAG: hypothetical protein U5J62_07205 [Desulfurivibrio sp.]|nr:hypothetical protein [Desulfurivibrio sp.]